MYPLPAGWNVDAMTVCRAGCWLACVDPEHILIHEPMHFIIPAVVREGSDEPHITRDTLAGPQVVHGVSLAATGGTVMLGMPHHRFTLRLG